MRQSMVSLFLGVLLVAALSVPAAAFLEIGYDRTITAEYGPDHGPVIGLDNVLTIQLAGRWTLGAVSGPEFFGRTNTLRWNNDVYATDQVYTLGVSWHSGRSWRVYAMYTF